MKTLRPLLRLDDKLAAEGRRLEAIGGPSLRWAGPFALLVAGLLHGIVLLLPAAHFSASPPPRSVPTDFPLVWRAPAPVAPAMSIVPVVATGRVVPTSIPRKETTVASDTQGQGRAVATSMRDLTLEPVPEPAPDLALGSIEADVEAIIPNPDPPPVSPEIGPPAGALPESAPALIESVQPVYPPGARSLMAEGDVTLRLSVLPDGTVGRAAVESCSRPGLGFEAAALAAVKRWRYEPAPPQQGTRKVTVTVRFQRQGDDRP